MKYIKLFEKFRNDKLNEVIIQASSNFTDILVKINDRISNKILELIESNTDLTVNFNYIDVNPDGTLSFINDTKSKDFELWGGPRQNIKVGRIIRNILIESNFSHSEKELEDFINKFKSQISNTSDKKKFEIFYGEDIYKFYNSIDYDKENGLGQLGKSCMNRKPADFFQIYTKNPNKVGLIVLFDENKNMIGRSLLWKTENEFLFMDRIYTFDDSDIDLFKLQGDEKGYWYKDKQNTSYMSRDNFVYKFDICSNNDRKQEDIIVKLDNYDFNIYPYLDSLCYYNSNDGLLSNNRFLIDSDLLLCNMDGHHKDSDFEWVF